MIKKILLPILFATSIQSFSQDLSYGLVLNDTANHPMQAKSKPAYLDTIHDPSFGTVIRRITNAGAGNVIVPMYSTVQAWNSDETYMILYNKTTGDHILLNGKTYAPVRTLTDVSPIDIEQIFWDFNNPDAFYYPEKTTYNFIKYTVSTSTKQTIFNLDSVTACTGGFTLGNDVQMMSWDSDLVTFRCNNDTVYSYRISTQKVTTLALNTINYVAPMPAPSGNLLYHRTSVYDTNGVLHKTLNASSTEHNCLGKLSNGNDALFSVAFAQGPSGGCLGDIIAHDLDSGYCYDIISQAKGYNYTQSGVHISSLAHKNTEGGWIAASMMGYNKDGQSLLDQELVIAKAEEGNVKVCRIGHHRSDADDWSYWGEPHAVISPTGTRVLFASDWSGTDDGHSIDCYVVELPIHFLNTTSIIEKSKLTHTLFPNPTNSSAILKFNNSSNSPFSYSLLNSQGQIVNSQLVENSSEYKIEKNNLPEGVYFYTLIFKDGTYINGKIVFN